ncbi:hypothetical protein BGAL_0401g00020 [Botrytis galanthina]|uniref:NADP-dependent oxidoreductase domain-containing protein n=1 Tax=Botrytis galanthina TaxID=278940 RepID=A0A4S8QML1_9HELO|nr:hypothetical protein BGAL_0401g00020 [Botrytis galanthina]
MTIPIPTLKLNTGAPIPALGFGTFQNEGSPGKCHDAVLWALQSGYRHLDCAWYYKNEEEVGSGLREFLSSNPSVKRSDIFITTKVWPHLCGSPEDVEWSLNYSLEKLGVDYVDSFLMHMPFAAERTDDYNVKIGDDGKYIINKEVTANLEPIWRRFEALNKAGKTKSIGVSNFTISNLEALLKYAEIPPAMNQVEIHPAWPNTKLVNYCFSKNILPAAYSPLGSQSQSPTTSKPLIQNSELISIAEKKGVSIGQILIAWNIKRGCVVLPMSSNEGRIKTNGTLVYLTEEEFESMNKVYEGKETRFVDLTNTFGWKVFGDE